MLIIVCVQPVTLCSKRLMEALFMIHVYRLPETYSLTPWQPVNHKFRNSGLTLNLVSTLAPTLVLS